MKVITIKRFKDLKENKQREVEEEFEVTKERFDEILKVGKYVKEVKQPKKAASKKAVKQPKKAASKKAVDK